MSRPVQKCPACGGVLNRHHYKRCPKVDRARKARDMKTLNAALKKYYAAKRTP